MTAASLLLGTSGYHFVGHLPWLDAFYNASMIMGGMGPVDHLDAPAAKLFASLYALFCGLAFIAMVGIVLAPVAHRLLHKFHLEEKDDGDDEEDSGRARKRD